MSVKVRLKVKHSRFDETRIPEAFVCCFALSFMGFKSEQAQVAYLLSLSATEYIIREFGIFSVRNILENLGGGMGLDEAVSAALRISYSDLERLWAGSLKDG